MATRSGPNSKKQLQKGRKRYLSPSEISRGNLYVTNAKSRDEFMDEYIVVIFNNIELPLRKVDSYGRIFIGTDILDQHKSNLLNLKLVARNKLLVQVVG
jgi:hypothetical protein